MSLKTEALAAVGGFDEIRFPFGYEDIELGRGLHDRTGLRLRTGRRRPSTCATPPWRSGAGAWRGAACERRFVARYPDVQPYFHAYFSAAAGAPRAPRARGVPANPGESRLAVAPPRA